MRQRDDQTAKIIKQHYAGEAPHYSGQYEDGYTGYPANLKRLQMLLSRFRVLRPTTLLDCGCGEGTPMGRINDLGTDVWGFDLVPEMVERAREQLGGRGLADHVWVGDITERAAFQHSATQLPATFDICMAMGVFQHLEEEDAALKNMADYTRTGGRVFVMFRNELFSLFTFNRYSYELYRDKLLHSAEVGQQQFRSDIERILEDIEPFFRLDLPPAPRDTTDAPGGGQVLAKFHNPFEVDDLFKRSGLQVVNKFFYHYHAVPPMFESQYPEMFRSLSLQMEENPLDWRGYFMASAFVVEAVKPELRQ